MMDEILRIVAETRSSLINKYPVLAKTGLDGCCKEAADILVSKFQEIGLRAEKCFGWCLYDHVNNSTGEPCAPHCYVLLHTDNKILYVDCTATQFSSFLNEEQPAIIVSEMKPYWLYNNKPTLEMMESRGY